MLRRNNIDISNCRAQAYNDISAISSDRCGAVLILKKEQPLTEYIHCRNHILNLAICFPCKNQSVPKFMDNLTTLCFFFEDSPKRHRYFKNFIEFYREKLNLSENRHKEIIDLSKTRWVERHKAYKTYLVLFKATVFTLESICEQQLQEEFYESLENKQHEKWTWDRDTKTTAQRLFMATQSFERILSFAVVFNTLESIKLLVTKLQTSN